MKFTALRTILMLCAACGVMTTAHGVENDEQPRIPVGERSLPPAEKKAFDDEQYQIVKEAVENGAEATDSSGEESRIEETIVVGNDDEQVAQKSLEAKTNYVTTHEGALHRPVSVSLFGDFVELEDGSIFTVRPEDRMYTLDWLITDTILILPGSTWAYYDYELVNTNTGVVVQVDLTVGPIYNGIYTHWIVGIDYYNHRICLEDGSLWDVLFWDRGKVDSWLVGDTVLIGVNDGWFNGSRPNILINVNLNQDIKCDCIF